MNQANTGLDPSAIGSIEFFCDLVDKVVTREPGFGADLAEGWYYVCEKLGPRALELYDKGINMETGCKDFQLVPGWNLKGTLPGNVISAMGIRRQNSISNYLYYSVQLDPSITRDKERLHEITANVSRKFVGDENVGTHPDDVAYAGIGARFTIEQNTLLDTLAMCGFAFPNTFSNYTEDGTGELFAAAFLNDVCGSDFTEDDMSYEFADRIINLERLISIRGGHVQDKPHAATLIENGGFYSREDIEQGLRDLYKLMGWDEQTGWPRKSTLRKLGLEREIEDMVAAGYELPE